MSPHVAIVGGGVTGLAAALEVEARGGRATILEADDRPGGKLSTSTLEGVPVEWGADAFLARDQTAYDLCIDLGLKDELVQPAVFGATVYSRGRTAPLPPGFFLGLPTSPVEALRSRALSAGGALRAYWDLLVREPLRGPDVSVGHLIRRHFGDETLDRLVDPILAGTRAGDPDEIGLAAAYPTLDRLARAEGSLIRAIRRARSRGHKEIAAPSFFGLRGGMSQLIDAMRARLKDTTLLTGARVQRIESAATGFDVVHPGGGLPADGVVLAVPAAAAAPLLAPLAPDAAKTLATFASVEVAVINLLFGADLEVDLPGSGLLVAGAEGRTLAAATWVWRKWPHVAPGGPRVLRAFVGRRAGDAANAADDVLVARVRGDLRDIAGISAEPHAARVERTTLPRYPVGHLDKVAEVRAGLARVGPLQVAGASYDGSGLPECIGQGRTAARALTGAG